METYVIGDTHGCHIELVKCLESVNFDYENDRLIHLGDIVDRGPDSYSCIQELIKIKKLISIQGNHDEIWYEYLKLGDPQKSGLWKQGAQQTWESYYRLGINPLIHLEFFQKQIKYYIDEENNWYVHGGFVPELHIEDQEDTLYTWDRTLITAAREIEILSIGYKSSDWITGSPKNVFIGHTPVQYLDKINIPKCYAGIWNLDTGAGKFPSPDGKVTIMNVKTKQFNQF